VKTRFFPICLLLTILIATSARAADPETVSLEMRFSKGDVYVYALRMNMDIASSIKQDNSQAKPMPMSMNMVIEAHMRMDIQDVSATGTANGEMRFTDVKLTTNNQTMSSGSPDSPKGPLAALTKERMKFRMDKNGRTSMEMPSSDAMAAKLGLSGMLEQLQPSLPDKPITVGETWEQTIDMSSLLGGNSKSNQIPLKVKFNFVGFEKVKDIPCAKLEMSYKGDIKDLTSEVLERLSSKSATEKTSIDKMSQDMKGTIYFAHEKGVFIGVEFELVQDSEIRVESVSASGKSSTMQQHIRMKGSLELE
jgi:hypothetical protein